MYFVIDFLRLLLILSSNQVLLIAGEDEAEAGVLLNLYYLIGQPAARQI